MRLKRIHAECIMGVLIRIRIRLIKIAMVLNFQRECWASTIGGHRFMTVSQFGMIVRCKKKGWVPPQESGHDQGTLRRD